MSKPSSNRLAPLALLAALPLAQAATQVVDFSNLNASATVATPLLAGDTLRLDTLVTTETGALSQQVTFTLGAGVGAVSGQAAWEVGTAAGPGPRLTGVDINIFNAANALVVSDSGVTVANGFATSSIPTTLLTPGTYRVVATGTGNRESSLDLSLVFAVPEPGSYALMLAGGAVVLLTARRRPNRSSRPTP